MIRKLTSLTIGNGIPLKFAVQTKIMYRSNTCGALRASNIDSEVILSGWVHKVRDKGFVVWVDLRDRYGITQL
ncbi:MAG: hypothetical protein ABJP86_13345, partial [Flavobacteriaceae bacterium]